MEMEMSPPAAMASMKALVPDFAMVPRLLMSSFVGVKADAELPDHGDVFDCCHGFHQGRCTRLCHNAQVVDQLVLPRTGKVARVKADAELPDRVDVVAAAMASISAVVLDSAIMTGFGREGDAELFEHGDGDVAARRRGLHAGRCARLCDHEQISRARFPEILLVVVSLAHDMDLVPYEVAEVKADAELPDHERRPTAIAQAA
eukprot:CAMPEP_0183604752 /NCGR_PEP_ID=MMETSP0371-20130417/182106_1 /TAXON_ID=268820 /ORGANISM="Peridinium aciculiferum, Strain PAER-2" /LENGTH=202 /DNA_ID=CAMNT_0025816853 /DNA_START=245 /DNA_END=855 /DNA_ORIENTATION=-